LYLRAVLKQKKAILFFSAGIGDAVLLIPLVKKLKSKGFWVTGFFNSKHPCEDIFKDINLLDELIVCKSKSGQFIHSFKQFLKYDSAYINYFATNRNNLLTAAISSKQVFINRKVDSMLFRLFSFKIKYVEPVKNIHDAQQNLNLLDYNTKVSLPDFYINYTSTKNGALPYPFIAVQISASNNKQTYKNWDINYWISFLTMLLEQYPERKIVLLGDKNEVDIAAKITDSLGSKVNSLAGKTTIKEAMHILNQSELFIGLDGGLMHLAVALGKPTFSIWGPSSVTLYGYEKFSPVHKCVSLNLPCSPCSAWINANHTKATNPELCPDHACTQQLMPQDIFTQFKEYLNLLPYTPPLHAA
jgi:ADP-heptose:LPS heptosyltransferase